MLYRETFDFLVDVINGTIEMEKQRARAEMQNEEAMAIECEAGDIGGSVATEVELDPSSSVGIDAKDPSSQAKDV